MIRYTSRDVDTMLGALNRRLYDAGREELGTTATRDGSGQTRYALHTNGRPGSTLLHTKGSREAVKVLQGMITILGHMEGKA